MEWQGVFIKTKNVLYRKNIYRSKQTNNSDFIFFDW